MSKFSARGPAWQAQRLRVLDRDGWICAYCGGEATEVDHANPIALSEGATYTDDMLLSACKPCNASKGAKPLVRVFWFNPRYVG